MITVSFSSPPHKPMLRSLPNPLSELSTQIRTCNSIHTIKTTPCHNKLMFLRFSFIRSYRILSCSCLTLGMLLILSLLLLTEWLSHAYSMSHIQIPKILYILEFVLFISTELPPNSLNIHLFLRWTESSLSSRKGFSLILTKTFLTIASISIVRLSGNIFNGSSPRA